MSGFLTPYQFRFCPARYIHSDHLPDRWAGAMALMPDWRYRTRNNALLLDKLALTTEYLHPGGLGGLALYDNYHFRRTTVWLGAILHGRSIRNSMSAPVLRQVHTAIGEQGHRFCLSVLDLLIGEWPDEWQYPLPDGELSDYFARCGLNFWCSALQDAEPGFIQRIMLRLAKGSGGIKSSGGISGGIETCRVSHHAALAKVLCQKIVKKVSPECCHLLK